MGVGWRWDILPTRRRRVCSPARSRALAPFVGNHIDEFARFREGIVGLVDWVLIGSCVLLLVVIAQLSIAYQKQSGQLHMRQEPLRKRVQSLRHKVSSSAEGVRFNADSSLKDIELSVESLSHFDQMIGKAVEQLEADVQAMFPDDEADGVDHSAQLLLQGFDPRVVLDNVLRKREDIENHITLLRGDAANIRNNVQPLETAVARSEQKGKES